MFFSPQNTFSTTHFFLYCGPYPGQCSHWTKLLFCHFCAAQIMTFSKNYFYLLLFFFSPNLNFSSHYLLTTRALPLGPWFGKIDTRPMVLNWAHILKFPPKYSNTRLSYPLWSNLNLFTNSNMHYIGNLPCKSELL
jgi:hypothetical protein